MKRVTMHTLYAGPSGSVGVGQTGQFDDEEAEQLVAGGYGVYADAPRARAARRAAPDGGDKPVERMNVEELKAYAAEHDIDLGDATKKAELLATVIAELERRRDEDDGTED
ncbi:hypothetical protein [Streptomyces sp. NPDC093111]|uniref:hypothetical protein n=1 Tax=Bacteria TaxID=2 RepID=UPI00343DA306